MECTGTLSLLRFTQDNAGILDYYVWLARAVRKPLRTSKDSCVGLIMMYRCL